MPELPEVHTTVHDLQKIAGRRIVRVWSDAPELVKRPKFSKFALEIRGAKILRIERRGKNILIFLSGDRLLVIHQKLTGHLLIGKWRLVRRAGKIVAAAPPGARHDRVSTYIHLLFYLDNGSMIGLSDLRKFAKVLFGPRQEIEKLEDLALIGPDALDPELTFKKFSELIRGERRAIKTVLLDQEVIAGLGNIYTDEMLWHAKVHPLTSARRVPPARLRSMYFAMRRILKRAIRLRGSSVNTFRDAAGKKGGYSKIRVAYQRENEPCRRCGAPITRLKLGVRSAHFCPKCQRRGGGK